MNWTSLESADQINAITHRDQGYSLVIFKHSTACFRQYDG